MTRWFTPFSASMLAPWVVEYGSWVQSAWAWLNAAGHGGKHYRAFTCSVLEVTVYIVSPNLFVFCPCLHHLQIQYFLLHPSYYATFTHYSICSLRMHDFDL